MSVFISLLSKSNHVQISSIFFFENVSQCEYGFNSKEEFDTGLC